MLFASKKDLGITGGEWGPLDIVSVLPVDQQIFIEKLMELNGIFSVDTMLLGSK